MKKVLVLMVAVLFAASLLVSCERDEDVFRIGAIFPLSGPVSFFGIESRDGGLLAVEEINAAGGLLGKRLVLVYDDDEGLPASTVNIFSRFTERDGITMIFGSSTSGATMAITELAQRSRVLLMTPSATNIAVTQAGDFIFRACFTDPFQGAVGATFAFDYLGSRRAAILYDAGADYNTGLAEAFRDEFVRLGGEIVAFEAYMTGAVDFSAQVTRIRAANPDVVYLPNYIMDVRLQAMQLRDQEVNVPLVGGDGWDGVIADFDDDVMLNTFWSAGFASDTTDPKGRAFVEAFEARFNRPATQFAALGYDSIMLIADAIRAAETFEVTAVRDALAATDDYHVTGHIRFDENRNPVKPVAILEIQRLDDGRLANVSVTTVNP